MAFYYWFMTPKRILPGLLCLFARSRLMALEESKSIVGVVVDVLAGICLKKEVIDLFLDPPEVEGPARLYCKEPSTELGTPFMKNDRFPSHSVSLPVKPWFTLLAFIRSISSNSPLIFVLNSLS